MAAREIGGGSGGKPGGKDLGGGKPTPHPISIDRAIGGSGALEVYSEAADLRDGLINLGIGSLTLVGLGWTLICGDKPFGSVSFGSIHMPWYLLYPAIWIFISIPCIAFGIRKMLGDTAFKADETGISYTWFGRKMRCEWKDMATPKFRGTSKFGRRLAFPSYSDLSFDSWFNPLRIANIEPYSIPVPEQVNIQSYIREFQRLRGYSP